MTEKLKSILRRVQLELKVYKLILQDERTPLLSKILIGAAVGYFISPIDLIPDFIPVIGYLDDVIIVPTLIYFALRFIPKDVVQDCRLRAGC